ncbi:MAG: hypothetical protein PHZ26_04445 [Candidatus Gracilibacteria bacterium]|nr:hypothetical protein [Candidatus Gracilibacteria bacterium]MDD2908978.1 hypothetical protein [Candidatus Gracilibacteria bacterium]
MGKKFNVQIIFIFVLTFLVSGCSENKEIVKPEEKSNVAYSAYSTCLENTENGPEAKDCCDCLSDANISVRKACRDATVSYDFSNNTTYKTFKIPSILGENGDYSPYTISDNEQECKQKCEATTTTLVCGDFRYCRTACDKLSQ